jgi:hypothetical protein
LAGINSVWVVIRAVHSSGERSEEIIWTKWVGEEEENGRCERVGWDILILRINFFLDL